jgi:hypothetical protein
LIEAGDDIEGILPRYKARNKVAKGGMELLRVSAEFDKEMQGKAKAWRAKESDLKALGIADGEEPIRTDLLKGYSTTATAYERFAEAFHAGTKGFSDLVGIAQTTQTLGPSAGG